jgi:hypothetical protein
MGSVGELLPTPVALNDFFAAFAATVKLLECSQGKQFVKTARAAHFQTAEYGNRL